MSRTLLVDADIVAFKASSAKEQVFYFNGRGEPPAVEENLEAALAFASRSIEEYANTLKAARVIVCLTDEDNFRHSVYPAYKGNRSAVRRPSTLKAVKDFFAEKYETYKRPGLEADDCMGVLSTHKTLVPGEKIILSEDKDMQTIPGLLFNPAKDSKPRRISELEADRFFMWQTIVGDSTDGYPGCFGVGKSSKYAADVLAAPNLKAMWEIVLAAYASKKKTPEEALVQARCARILRASDWDWTARKPRLWCPPV